MEYIIVFVISYFIYRKLKEKNKREKQKLSQPSASKSKNIIPSIASHQEEEFASFYLYRTNEHQTKKSKNRSPGVWLPLDKRVKIKGRQLEKGLIYYGGALNGLIRHNIEPSLVDEKRDAYLPTSFVSNKPIYEDSTLGYWPSYANLSPQCRGVYLDWLASDRSHSEMPIGYIFIYFYGLERYFLENAAQKSIKHEEVTILYQEVLRLHEIYNKNPSFSSYSAALLEYMYLCYPQVIDPKTLPADTTSMLFKVELARKVIEEKPIPAELALLWLKNTAEYTFKVPARRCHNEFQKLFVIRYKEKFAEGIKVKPNKKKLQLTYHSASSTNPSESLTIDGLCDPTSLKAPINKLIPIADSCTEELNAYSRYMARQESKADDVDALMLLPDILIDSKSSAMINTFQDWVHEKIQNNQGLVSVQDFWAYMAKDMPERWGKKENNLMIQFSAKAGFGLAPDFRYHPDKMKKDGKLVLYSLVPEASFEPSQEFKRVCTSIKLGSIIAHADGNLDPSEVRYLSSLIDDNDHIFPLEKISLNAYLTWNLHTEVSLNGLKTQLKDLNRQEIKALRHLIVSVALADGYADKEEIKKLEKLYTSLGLEKTLVSSDIHHLTSNKEGNISTSKAADDTTFSLDTAKIASYEDETSHVQAMLQNVFYSQNQLEEELANSSQKTNASTHLDKQHHGFYSQLIEKEKWLRDDAIILCQEHNLMLDGAIETINDWAFDIVDAPMLEDEGSHIYVDFEIVEELRY